MRFALLVLLFASSCGNPTIIDGESYSRACTANADCVAVFFGNQCDPCGCPNTTIATQDEVTYHADRSAALAACGPRPEIACGPCQDRRPFCAIHSGPLSDDTTNRFCELP